MALDEVAARLRHARQRLGDRRPVREIGRDSARFGLVFESEGFHDDGVAYRVGGIECLRVIIGDDPRRNGHAALAQFRLRFGFVQSPDPAAAARQRELGMPGPAPMLADRGRGVRGGQRIVYAVKRRNAFADEALRPDLGKVLRKAAYHCGADARRGAAACDSVRGGLPLGVRAPVGSRKVDHEECEIVPAGKHRGEYPRQRGFVAPLVGVVVERIREMHHRSEGGAKRLRMPGLQRGKAQAGGRRGVRHEACLPAGTGKRTDFPAA